ncbi:MAG TPA: YtxH domain-containing protein [Syntrophorhabdaceae bacterium]|nr:YtxH domain-containing protein [Syntrophorhabdaceae bacterium]
MSDQGSGFTAGTILLSFFFGGLIGAGVALLTAPKTGEETRRMIKELAGDVKEKAEGYIDQAKGTATAYIEKGVDFVEKERDVITKTVEAGKEAYEKEKNANATLSQQKS